MESRAELERADKWCKETQDMLAENKGLKILWDFKVQCDRMVEVRKLDIVFIDKQAMEAKIMDIAIQRDARVKDKELRK